MCFALSCGSDTKMRARSVVAGVFVILVCGLAADLVSATALSRAERKHLNRVDASDGAGGMIGRVFRGELGSYRVLEQIGVSGPTDYDLTKDGVDRKTISEHHPNYLGRGNHGRLFKAVRLTDGGPALPARSPVALKFMDAPSDAEFILAKDAFDRAVGFCKEYFPRMIEHFEVGGQFVHVMEYLEGVSLDKAIAAGAFGDPRSHKRVQPNDFRRIDKVWTGLKHAVACLHHMHIIHSDLKPQVHTLSHDWSCFCSD